jgi:hypothetical protein
VDNGESLPVRPRYFFFATKTWKEAEDRCPEACYSLDSWHGCLVLLRTKLKGWNIKRLGEQKKEKKELMEEHSSIDKQSETRELLAEEWSH